MTVEQTIAALAQEIRDESYNRLTNQPMVSETEARELAIERYRNRRAIDVLIESGFDVEIAAAKALRSTAVQKEMPHEAKRADEQLKELREYQKLDRRDLVIAIEAVKAAEANANVAFWSTLHRAYRNARDKAVAEINTEILAEAEAARKAVRDQDAQSRADSAEAKLRQAGL
jgi:hypothetical protein